MNRFPSNIILYSGLILILLTGKLSGQNHELGIELGAGQTIIEERSTLFIPPLFQEADKFRRIGVNYFFTPDSAMFSLKSGLTFDQRNSKSTVFNYLRLPVGIEIHPGNKLQLILGLGIYGSVLLSTTNNTSYYISREDEFNKFQLGGIYSGGIGLQLSRKINISAQYQGNLDIVQMYTEDRSSPGGQPYVLKMRGFDGFIKLGVKFRIID